MRVLGIDCGTEYTGYGVVKLHEDGKLQCLDCGAIKLSPRDSMPSRLATIFNRLSALISEHQQTQVAIEDIFYSLNVKSALKLGQVRGVAILAASSVGLAVVEYAPLTIKSATLSPDNKTVYLEMPEIRPCWNMKITYNIKAADGSSLQSEIINTIHNLSKD